MAVVGVALGQRWPTTQALCAVDGRAGAVELAIQALWSLEDHE